MKDIKIIKRKTSGNEQNELPVLQKQTSTPAKFQREMTAVITGWINDLRGRTQPDARAAFYDLFEISGVWICKVPPRGNRIFSSREGRQHFTNSRQTKGDTTNARLIE
jgi:hypothetical protein